MAMIVDPKNRCLFCLSDLKRKGTRIGKSNEDVIPRWLAKHLEIESMPITPMRVTTESGIPLDWRQHTVSNLLAGKVCSGCNNGWMSDLEGMAKPILMPLIADPTRLGTLTQEDRYILSRWTLKTVGVLNRCSTHGDPNNPHARPVPDEHLAAVKAGRLPDRIHVVAGVYRSLKPLDWLQFATWATPKSSASLLPEDRDGSYKIALAFRDLILAVAYYPAWGYTYSAVEGVHLPIWTGNQELVLIDDPGMEAPIVSSSPALEAFLRNIYIVSDTWLTLIS